MVDDNKVIRQLIRVNLELEGFEVVTAGDGAECLEIVHSVRPDVVTLDVVMPRLDGIRTAARLRSDPRTRTLGIVMVSAGPLPDGAVGDAYLAKPFEPAELVETVRGLVCRGATIEHPAIEHVAIEHAAIEHPTDQPPEQPCGRTAAHPGA